MPSDDCDGTTPGLSVDFATEGDLEIVRGGDHNPTPDISNCYGGDNPCYGDDNPAEHRSIELRSESTVKYDILGPLRVTSNGREVPVKANKIALLLSVLLVRANRAVSINDLLTEFWRREPPRRAMASIHVYIHNLRRALVAPGVPGSPIDTVPAGYVLSTRKGELDLDVFENCLREGKHHERGQRYEEALDCLDTALNLWRGRALENLQVGPILSAAAAWLEEARVETTERAVEIGLILGRHRDLVGQLYALTEEHPLREVFHRQLMLALYRSERQADALRVFQRLRMRLVEDLGLEPARSLNDLHRAILRQDERLVTPSRLIQPV